MYAIRSYYARRRSRLPLGLLILVWCAGRAAALHSSRLPPIVAPAVDGVFFLGLAAAIARPIINTDYERPLQPGGLDMPHLVYDDLDRGLPLKRAVARRVELAADDDPVAPQERRIEGRELARITSYNVCYTKLLRSTPPPARCSVASSVIRRDTR